MKQVEKTPVYQIQVRGLLDSSWSEWFGGMLVDIGQDAGGPSTVISGPVPDQAALQGILVKVWNLNLPILRVTCLSGYALPVEAHRS